MTAAARRLSPAQRAHLEPPRAAVTGLLAVAAAAAAEYAVYDAPHADLRYPPFDQTSPRMYLFTLSDAQMVLSARSLTAIPLSEHTIMYM
ncbi:unnamed protein product [Pieris macdunnoughi]|uniref:Uncharacterized protein n=1 Tax=Pieris macdunnoughi TaxID=345717 RepID=A0A821SA81_9NEOP|nr:unnamed protein product [Pieris macdunnoughi]